METTEDKKINDLIDMGSEIAGGAVGGALGFFAGGPLGAAGFSAGGVMITKALRWVGNEVSERFMSKREKIRVGAVLVVAADEINRRIRSGEQIRTDDFFKEKTNRRSDAEEVAESVLLKAKGEPEEKKIPYMAHLLANIAFDNRISAGMAHQLLKAAEQLTYRQLCILKLAAAKKSLTLRATDYRGSKSFSRELYQVLYECLDLYTRSFVNFGGEVAFGPTDIKPASMDLQGIGADIYNEMHLVTIPDADIIPIANQLK